MTSRGAHASMADNLGFAIPVNYVKQFLHHREAFSFDKANPNSGYRYLDPPRRLVAGQPEGLKASAGRRQVPGRRSPPARRPGRATGKGPLASGRTRFRTRLSDQRIRRARRSPPAENQARSLRFTHGPRPGSRWPDPIPSAGEPRVARTNGVLSDAYGEAGDASLGPGRLAGTLRLTAIVGGTRPRPRTPPERVLPDSTIFLFKINDVKAFREAFRGSHYGQLWNDPAMKDFRDDLARSSRTSPSRSRRRSASASRSCSSCPRGRSPSPS